MSGSEVFLLRHCGGAVVYSPLTGAAAAVDEATSDVLARSGIGALPQQFLEMVEAAQAAPARLEGPFAPACIGLVVTRSCNLCCRYCDFKADDDSRTTMGAGTAFDAIAAMADVAVRDGRDRLEVHFFGGEPTLAIDLVRNVVERSRAEAVARDLDTWFEMTTNGVADDRTLQWTGANVDRVVLSLDGTPESHDEMRVRASGRGSGDRAFAAAQLLDEASCELVLRSCVSSSTADAFPENLAKVLDQVAPRVVSLEPVHSRVDAPDMRPPTAEQFCRAFAGAREICDAHGLDLVFSGADLTRKAASPCGVARDGCVVQPDGELGACYLPPFSWRRQGLELAFGKVEESPGFEIDNGRLEGIRRLDVGSMNDCRGCPCRWHCGGGCRVRRAGEGADPEWCESARAVTAFQILAACGVDDLQSAVAAASSDWWLELRRGGPSS